MEGEKILMAAGVTVAAVVGAFVFWGPSGSSRLRQRRGQIAGLHNFGRTCFLNTLLQALAACPQFIAWLQLYNGVSMDKKNLITSLLNTLEIVNGTHPTLRGDPYSPGAVIRALNNLRWVIPQGEQDAHELLHVMLASLEEESTRPKKVGCLSDALLPEDGSKQELMPPQRPSSALLSDFLNAEYDESTNLMRQVRSEAHTPDSPASICDEEGEDRVNGSRSLMMDSPGAVIRALNNLRWVIPQGEQDAHELLHVMLASLEEESTRPKKVGCLSDALLPEDGSKQELMPPQRPSSALLSDFLNAEYDESTNLMRQVRSEAHTPDSPASICDEEGEDRVNGSRSLMMDMNEDPTMSPNLSIASQRQSRCRSVQTQMGDGALNRKVSSSCRSLERLSRGPGRVSIWSDQAPLQVPHPFQGALGSQIVCNGCGFKSTVRYDKFDSITLHLPDQRRSGLSLGHLLSEFIASENLTGVKCDSCSETTNHTKSLTFAKLPACLCIHISRTVWLPTGQVCKRQDYVHFPESLSMAPYSFVQPHLNSQANTPWGSTMSLFSTSVPTNSNMDTFGSFNTFGSMFPRNLYRLLAVVVHSGEANSGHFVTYRRGALRSSHRWFYTSDTVVREVSIDEVLSVPAYLLFYDRGPQKMPGSINMR